MFLTSVLIFHLISTTVGNPFQKYPFVFLLDVGNEEIQKTAEEQIRISVPGGSLALRYPGTNEDKLIAHVRVSGIDFGTDLKADIVEGGPGYNYVVLLFKGNPGVPYDAVLTVQTLSSDSTNYNIIQKDISNMSDDNSEPNQVPEGSVESNENAEDENGNSLGGNNNNQNEELTQYSSNVYNYAHNQHSNGGDSDEDGNDDNIEAPRSEEDINADESDSAEDSLSGNDSGESENAGVSYTRNYHEQNEDSPKAEPRSGMSKSFTKDESYDGEDPDDLPSDVYRRYNELTSNDFQEVQEALDDSKDDELRGSNHAELPDNGQEEMDQNYNDEEIHIEGKELNNNYPDFDEIPPAES